MPRPGARSQTLHQESEISMKRTPFSAGFVTPSASEDLEDYREAEQRRQMQSNRDFD